MGMKIREGIHTPPEPLRSPGTVPGQSVPADRAYRFYKYVPRFLGQPIRNVREARVLLHVYRLRLVFFLAGRFLVDQTSLPPRRFTGPQISRTPPGPCQWRSMEVFTFRFGAAFRFAGLRGGAEPATGQQRVRSIAASFTAFFSPAVRAPFFFEILVSRLDGVVAFKNLHEALDFFLAFLRRLLGTGPQLHIMISPTFL